MVPKANGQRIGEVDVPGSIRASNKEIMGLKPELEKMIPYWSVVKLPLLLYKDFRMIWYLPAMQILQKKCW